MTEKAGMITHMNEEKWKKQQKSCLGNKARRVSKTPRCHLNALSTYQCKHEIMT